MPRLSLSFGRAVLLSLGIVLFGVGSVSSQAAEPKRILLLHSYGQEGAPLDAFVHSF